MNPTPQSLPDDPVILFRGGEPIELGSVEWAEKVRPDPDHVHERLAFMSPDHRAVREFVVREMVRTGRPIAPEAIATAIGLTGVRVASVVQDLEERLFFLVRDGEGSVSWAFPVTADRTPHRLTFSTGERLYAA